MAYNRKTAAAIVSWAACLTACSNPPAKPAADSSTAANADNGANSNDLTALDLTVPDTGPAKQVCPGDSGCPCQGDGECSIGVCADDGSSPTGRACAFGSENGCAAGMVAFAKSLAGGEVKDVCVPAAPKLCNPCDKDDDCKATGGSGSLCVDKGAAGRFCGVACPSAGCPSGYECADVASAGGGKGKQCVPVSGGACVCSPAAKALQLATPCQTVNAAGACGGLRTCGSAGLSECSAKTPAAETCNSQDDNCNGQTDEGPLCDDGDGCTVGDACVAGACKAGLAKGCNDQNDCTADSCDKATGTCAFAPANGSLCSDGNPCTAGEACSNGKCTGGAPSPCACSNNADCAGQEDGNYCNGTLYCDLAAKVCTINPATIVACPADVTACQLQQCQPANGKCAAVNLPDTSTCSDGLAWTVGDICVGGQCVPGTETKLCKANSDCLDDGDLCNGTPFCNKATGVCQLNPKTVIYCPTADDTSCRQNLCQPKTGACVLTNINELKACEDGNLCTTGEACQAGVCTGTADTCVCKADADCGKFEDGNACNGTLFCNLASQKCEVNPKTVVVCPSVNDGPCAANTCDKASGKCAMQATAGKVPCDADSSPCTPIDLCSNGACVADTANICQCVQDADCADDGDLCNGVPYCDKAKNVCKPNPATVVACNLSGDTSCTVTACNPATGKCAKTNTTWPCSDGDACTVGDTCANGGCKSGANTCGACKGPADCNDSNPCTDDSCSGQPAACAHLNNGLACIDGDACTESDTCAGGKCKGNPAACDDKNKCTDDSCDPAKGCVFKPLPPCDDGNACTIEACANTIGCAPLPTTGTCTDNNACTVGDNCSGGTCMAGAVTACDDGNTCTQDSCDPGKGCVFATLADGATCSDGNVCTANDACKSGACAGGPAACLNAVGCPPTGFGTVCANGQGKCDSGHCLQTDAKGHQWTLVPAGKFWMGCNAAVDDACANQPEENPQHQVDTSAYWIGVYEITADAYKSCVSANAAGCTLPGTTGGASSSTYGTGGKGQHPVNFVTWAQAQAACQWLGGDLPTEAQWEKAARGGCEVYAGKDCKASAAKYPWGNAEPVCGVQSVFATAKNGCGTDSTYPVGTGSAQGQSPYGAFDMGGNVSEWVLDWYDSGFYAKPEATFKDAVNATPTTSRGGRGGSFLQTAVSERASKRGGGTIGANTLAFGFRCAKPMLETVCDGQDDNGNGQTDEGCDDDGDLYCDATLTTVGKPAICPKGGNDCNDAAKNAYPGAPELCDGYDNECNGTIDEGCNAVGCMASGKGAPCGKGQGTCDSGHCLQTDAKGHQWTLVPAGKFWMGCNAAVDTNCQADEKPQHEVDLSAYWIGVYEVTADSYKNCVTTPASGCQTPATTGGNNDSTYGTSGKAQHPINWVNWASGQAACKWLGGDLPTEAQWEKAARGGCEAYAGKDCQSGEYKFPWGNGDPVCGQQAAYYNNAWCGGTQTTFAVGAASPKGASPYGAFDMAGNVLEWTIDYYDSTFYSAVAATKKDPVKAIGAAARVIRGGSYDFDATKQRASFRTSGNESYVASNIGLRCAKPMPETWCDGQDDNGNGQTDEGCDDDGDGYCDASMTTVGKPAICPKGGNDCNDNAKTINSAATEQCDGFDNDCNGTVDDGCNAVGCMATGKGAACGNGKGTCDNGHCLQTDAKGYQWTLVPAGNVFLGCNVALDAGCDGSPNENPQHQVELSAYWVGVFEVTAAQYKACVSAGASGCTAAGSGSNSTYGVSGQEKHPVNYVNWPQSQAVCQWLGGDLPTEAQWEKAARGGCDVYAGKSCKASEAKYPWGSTDPVCGTQAVFKTGIAGCATNATYEVGTGSAQGASPYGAYDMAGNVWEWALDWYDSGFYSKGAATAKDVVNSTTATYRAFRGGSMSFAANTLRASFRDGTLPSGADFDVGVRCAKPAQ